MGKKVEWMSQYIGQRVTFFCLNYIYTGKLTAVGAEDASLEDAAIVYETGTLTDSNWKDAQKLPHKWNVKLSAIESYGILK